MQFFFYYDISTIRAENISYHVDWCILDKCKTAKKKKLSDLNEGDWLLQFGYEKDQQSIYEILPPSTPLLLPSNIELFLNIYASLVSS